MPGVGRGYGVGMSYHHKGPPPGGPPSDYLVTDTGSPLVTDTGSSIGVNAIYWFIIVFMFAAGAFGQTPICTLPDQATAGATDEIPIEANCGGTSQTRRLAVSDLWAGHDAATSYSGVGACTTGQFVNALNDEAAPDCAWITVRVHATDCTLLVDGVSDEICWELDDNRMFKCEPTAGNCDTAGEWDPLTIGEAQITFLANDGSRHDHVEADVTDLAHFTPNASPSTDHPSFNAETDARIALHTAVVDAHIDHADTLAELNTQIGASIADGPHDGTGYDTIDDEGTPLTQRATLNMIGTIVSCVDDGPGTETDCTFTDHTAADGTGYDTVDDEDTPLTQRGTLNFEGAGVTCADDINQTTCTIPGGGVFTSFDITDTDASPILTVDDGEQIQYIGAGTVTVAAAADGANHDVTITGSAHDGTGYDTIDDEGTPLTQRATLNMIGTIVSCVDDGPGTETDCTFTDHTTDTFGYDEVLDEASGLTKRAQLNFIGAGVTCVDNAGSTRTDCTITGGGGGGAYTAAGSTEISPASAINLTHATNNEVAHTTNYTVNKAAGNSTGFLLNFATDTASPGTDLLADYQYLSVSQASFDVNGRLLLDQEGGFGSTTGIAFSDGGTALYENNGNDFRLQVDGAVTLKATSSLWQFGSGNTAPSVLAASAASSTVPAFRPRSVDSDVGMGWPADNQVNLIAGGLNLLHLYGDGADQLADFNGQTITTASTQDYGIKFTQTLNDTVAGTTEQYAGFLMDITATDITGWTGGANLFDFRIGGTTYLSMTVGTTGDAVDLVFGDINQDLCWTTNCVSASSGNFNLEAWNSVRMSALRMPTEHTFQLTDATDLVFFEGDGDIRLEGDTDDANQTTISVTDPTAARTMVIPNADSVVPQSYSCAANNAATTLNGTTGATTCSEFSALGQTINESEMATEDYGDWSCGAGADDCLLDAGVVDATASAAAMVERSCGQFEFGETGDTIALTDEVTWRLPNFTGTLTGFYCETYSGTSFTVKLCDGEDRGDDTCTTDILSPATLECTTAGVSDTSLSATGFVAHDKVTLQVTAISGTPIGEVKLTCTVD